MAVLMAPNATELHDKLDRYLGSDPKHVSNAVHW